MPGFTLLTFGALLLLIALGYYRESEKHLGLTTEMAALLTFWLGYLVRSYEALSISAAIVLVLLLALRLAL